MTGKSGGVAIVVVNFIYIFIVTNGIFFYINSHRYADIIEAVNELSNLYNSISMTTAATSLQEASAMATLSDTQLPIEIDCKVADENWFIKEVSRYYYTFFSLQ